MSEIENSAREKFLEPETRQGYFIDAKMKRIWKFELDILEEFQRICKKHNLRYFVIAGTLIGALRNKGYIPWDDDIDVVMMRDQYDLFCKYALTELKDPYVLQTLETDKFYHEGFAKIRNPETTMITTWAREHKIRCNQGIDLDVFPLDAVASPKHLRLQANLNGRLMHARKVAQYGMRKDFRGWIADSCYWLFYHIVGNRLISRWREALFRNTKLGPERLVGPQAFTPLVRRTWWKKDWFAESVEMPFEYLTVSVPKGYDEILTQQFGEWRKPVKGTSSHTDILFDTERSYAEYLQEWGLC